MSKIWAQVGVGMMATPYRCGRSRMLSGSSGTKSWFMRVVYLRSPSNGARLSPKYVVLQFLNHFFTNLRNPVHILLMVDADDDDDGGR